MKPTDVTQGKKTKPKSAKRSDFGGDGRVLANVMQSVMRLAMSYKFPGARILEQGLALPLVLLWRLQRGNSQKVPGVVH